jgi:hypothetical protein
MDQIRPGNKSYRSAPSYRIALFAMLSLVLTACNTAAVAQAPTDPTPTETSVPVVTPLAPSTRTIAQRNATKAALLEAPKHALETRVASGTPFRPRPIILPTSKPVRTPVLGINTDCAQADHRFNFSGCWSGLVDGEYFFVNTITLKADPEQAQLRVYTMTFDLHRMGVEHYYSTPSKLGEIFPTDVTWPLITVTTKSGSPQATFVFDISTRQWVSRP